MKHTQKIKCIAALVLLSTLFLPLSKCSVKNIRIPVEPTQKTFQENTVPENPPQALENTKEKFTYTIPYEMVCGDDVFSWLIILAFMWPIPVLIYCFYGQRKKVITALKLIEPVASLGSGYLVWSLAFLGEIMYGGYLALASVVLYLGASGVDATVIIRNHFKTK